MNSELEKNFKYICEQIKISKKFKKNNERCVKMNKEGENVVKRLALQNAKYILKLQWLIMWYY